MYFIKNLLFTLTHPSYWIMLNRYSKPLDDWLIEQLNGTVNFDKYDGNRIYLKNKRFWVANKPYGFNEELIGARPSRLTIKKFYDKLESLYLTCEQS